MIMKHKKVIQASFHMNMTAFSLGEQNLTVLWKLDKKLIFKLFHQQFSFGNKFYCLKFRFKVLNWLEVQIRAVREGGGGGGRGPYLCSQSHYHVLDHEVNFCCFIGTMPQG